MFMDEVFKQLRYVKTTVIIYPSEKFKDVLNFKELIIKRWENDHIDIAFVTKSVLSMV